MSMLPFEFFCVECYAKNRNFAWSLGRGREGNYGPVVATFDWADFPYFRIGVKLFSSFTK